MQGMEEKVQDFILIFTGILYEALPFIVLGAVISGLLEELVQHTLALEVRDARARLPSSLYSRVRAQRRVRAVWSSESAERLSSASRRSKISFV